MSVADLLARGFAVTDLRVLQNLDCVPRDLIHLPWKAGDACSLNQLVKASYPVGFRQELDVDGLHGGASRMKYSRRALRRAMPPLETRETRRCGVLMPCLQCVCSPPSIE